MNNLIDIKGVGSATIKKLAELSIFNPLDVLNFLPKSYIDLKLPVTILETVIGQFSVIAAKILSISKVDFKHKGNFSLKLKSGNGVFKVIFFNQSYLQNNFKVGDEYLFLGKVQFDGAVRVLYNPVYEKQNSSNLDNNNLDNKKLDNINLNNKNIDNINFDNKNFDNKNFENSKQNLLQGIFTVYPTRGIISQNSIKKIISYCIENFNPQTLLSEEFCKNQNLTTLKETYRAVHHPKTIIESENARNRIALEDTINNIVFYRLYKKDITKTRKVLYNIDKNRIVEYKNAINSGFGYELTESQEKSVCEIFDDLNSEKLMNRIVVGDVGSGKTVLAFFASFLIATQNRQVAMLAPTEILAFQHYENFLKISQILRVKCALLTASTPKEVRKDILQKIENGEINFVVGTHSLLNDEIKFKNLSLVIYDEQQRFGVSQRDKLESKANDADILVLTATPIPRTLSLMFYDELSVSTIIKRDNAKTNINTRIVSESNKQNMFEYIAKQCKIGKKALIVCPKIFDSEGCTIYSAENLIKELRKKEFFDIPIEIIHGKQTCEQKSSGLEKLKNGQISALVCTSVVEVGIDIPDISYIVILNSEQFGLSQLHQLRGRIGRDGNEAFCFLHTSKTENDMVLSRLSTLVNTMNGYEIAENDFRLRGGGDFLGLNQSGDTFDSRHNLKIDSDIILKAKDIAEKLIADTKNSNDNSDDKKLFKEFDFSNYKDKILNVTNN